MCVVACVSANDAGVIVCDQGEKLSSYLQSGNSADCIFLSFPTFALVVSPVCESHMNILEGVRGARGREAEPGGGDGGVIAGVQSRKKARAGN